MTTVANAIIAPIHSKALPVILTTTEQFDLWLEGETIEALKLQRPLPDRMLDIVARGESEDGASDKQRQVPCVAAIPARGNVPT